jgi:putative ABC transport system permease protein
MFLELLRESLRSLRAHAFRYGLTAVGIVWGVLMLTYLSATMQGAYQHFIDEIEEVGPRIVWAFPGTLMKERIGERGARGLELEVEDVLRLEELISVEHADPNIALWSMVVRAGRRTKLLTVYGVTEDSRHIRNFEVAAGRFLSAIDVSGGARVAFLGAEAATRLFGREPAVGRTIQVESVRLRVVGVGEPKGDQMLNMGGQDDKQVLIPYTTAQRLFRQTERVEALIFAPRTREESGQAIWHTRQLTGLQHRFQPESDTALSFVNIQDILKIVYTIFFGIRLFLVSASLVTILVGAIGVMNIMLVVVRERTSEIGLRKAVGASDRAIFLQFVMEAVLVSTLSGLLGAVLGLGLVQLLASLLPADDPNASPPVLDAGTALATFLALVLTGVASGYLPARRAARIPPAEAVRS